MKMTGAKALLEALKREGVEIIFGYPGGAVIPIYDELYDSDIENILPRHEQAAGHAADAYARASGKVGVCMATSGPGATNLTTAIATAYMDSIPIVAITGQVRTSLIGTDAFQEADTTGITMPIVKHNYLVKKAEELPRIVREAFYIARSGRPGPVLIDLPVDVTAGEREFEIPDEVELESYKPTLDGHPKQIKAAAKLINAAERPVILAGGGVVSANAAEELKAVAKAGNLPVIHTLMGKGAFPESDELSVGMPGMHGTVAANRAIQTSDLLIAVGMRFDDRVTGKLDRFAPKAKVVHIDVDPAEIGKVRPATVPIVGDAKRVLAALVEHIEPKDRSDWLGQIKAWQEEFKLRYEKLDGEIHPAQVVEVLHKLTGGEALVTTEVGQNQMWAAQFYKVDRPRRFLTSGGLGTMGYGFPAALGAQVACPDDMVIDIAGDGSFQMNIQELGTAVQYELPVKVVVLDNCHLGMVRQWQELFWNKRYSNTPLCYNPDFVMVAEAYGAEGIRISKPEELEGGLKEALEIKDKPVVMHVRVAKEANVFPMVGPGAPIDEIMLSEADVPK